MDQTLIFKPFFGMMVLTLGVLVFLGSRRLPFIFRNRLSARQLSPVEFPKIAPPQVTTPADNFRNLFELPTIFYAVVLYLFLTHQVDTSYLIAAWVFFVFRTLHSAVHCTTNHIPTRFALYLASTFALMFMVGRCALAVLA